MITLKATYLDLVDFENDLYQFNSVDSFILNY